MSFPSVAAANLFDPDALTRGDPAPNPEPWVQAEIDKLRQRNRVLSDTLYLQTSSLATLKGVLADLKDRPASTPVAEALAIVSLERGLCSSCWSSVIPACACNRG